MAAKAAIKDVGRAMDIPYADVDRIAKMVPTQLNITLDQAIEDSPQLREAMEKDGQIRELMDRRKNWKAWCGTPACTPPA
jgi:DNA polymerase III subunit alpha